MAKSKGLLDECSEQTKVKHQYFDHYFLQWVLKIGQARINGDIMCENLIYVDSFCNAGEYKDKSEGSPIIALRKFVEFAKRHKTSQKFYLYFNDLDCKRTKHLESLIENIDIPNRVIVDVRCMEANNHIDYVLKEISLINRKKGFFFIDPYTVCNNVINPDKIVKILAAYD